MYMNGHHLLIYTELEKTGLTQVKTVKFFISVCASVQEVHK